MKKRMISGEEAKLLSELGKKVITVMYQDLGKIKITDRHNEYVTTEQANRIFDMRVLGYEVI